MLKYQYVNQPEYQRENTSRNRTQLDDKYRHQQQYQQEYYHFYQFCRQDFYRKAWISNKHLITNLVWILFYNIIYYLPSMMALLHDDKWYSRLISRFKLDTSFTNSAKLVRKNGLELTFWDTISETEFIDLIQEIFDHIIRMNKPNKEVRFMPLIFAKSDLKI